MLSPVECLLKAENYKTAARLDASGERIADYLRLAALWRARAVHLRTGGRTRLVNEPFDDADPEKLWNS